MRGLRELAAASLGVVVLGLVGCGSAGEDPTDQINATGSDASVDGVADAAVDSSAELPHDAAPLDAPTEDRIDAADGDGDGGGLQAEAGMFDCLGCACDGQTHYCYFVSGGVADPPPPDAQACTDAGGGCLPMPAECQPSPSCACLPTQAWGPCICKDVGGGLEIECCAP